jgi:hypothetical protein
VATRLNQSTKIWRLAKDLGIRSSNNPVSDILNFCEKRIKKFLKEAIDCPSLSDFLCWVAGKLDTSFEEIHSDDDLAAIKAKYLKQGEKIFATIDHEFSDEVLGITYRRSKREPWEPEFVSIIDCRGSNAARAYFTKWHEVAHLLILTDQSRLCFMRTVHLSNKDPEEVVIDLIAGKFGFYNPFVKPLIKGEISFEQIETLRQTLCPEASNLASLIGIVKAWPEPCLLVLCKKGLKKSESRQLAAQHSFDFSTLPIPVLRAIKVTPNEAAKEQGILIHENMRVPEHSVIYTVHSGKAESADAMEDLSWWETSSGDILTKQKISVKAKNYWGDTYALIIPKFNKAKPFKR